MNHLLARALSGARLDIVDVATQLCVDPKTVQRWISSGRIPYPRHRDALVNLTGWSAYDLWPSLPRPAEPLAATDEIRIVYPHRSAVPSDSWARLLSQAGREIDILVYSASFLADDVAVLKLLRQKAQAGVRVRIALGDPDGEHIASRGAEERIGVGMSARIRTALVSLQPLAEEPGIALRLHDTVLYNSTYRADDEMLINSHIYGRPAAQAPVMHLKRTDAEGMVSTHMTSFDRVWATAKASKLTAPPAI